MHKSNAFYSILFAITKFILVNGDDVILKIAQGTLRGVRLADRGYDSFNGIPYAGKVGETTRFRKAPPPTSWKDIRDAISPGSPCISAPGGHLQGNEDCLFLNVHVPTRTNSEPRFPVLVWVHGGGFTSGSGSPSLYGPAYLMKHKIILVTLNYRLGALGFLCLGHEFAPGNAGVKDVVLALRWVSDNIIAFGGDAARVTVAGQGTGAAIVDALTLSRMADGLYHGIIVQSGTVLSPWAFNYDAEARALNLAFFFNRTTDLAAKARSLTKARAGDLIIQSKKISFPYFPFAMCSEKSYRFEEKFLEDHPIALLRQNKFSKVPYMIGFNTNEGIIFSSLYKLFKKKKLLIPEELELYTKAERSTVTERIRDYYFTSAVDYSTFLTYMRDVFFLNHIHRNVQARLTHSSQSIFFYEYNFSGDDDSNNGSGHGDELKKLFGNENSGGERNSDLLPILWTNFVKFGNPTPQTGGVIPVTWIPASKGNLKLLEIGQSITMKPFESQHKMALWDELYDNYYFNRAGNS